MEIIVTVFYIAVCVMLFALAILIHEFGHFIVALKLGLRVEAFSIGFGKPIWRKKVNGVEYRISPILLGGYVSIPDVDPEGTKALEGARAKSEGEVEQRKKIPAWKEILVAVAGPSLNLVLAVARAQREVRGTRCGNWRCHSGWPGGESGDEGGRCRQGRRRTRGEDLVGDADGGSDFWRKDR